MFIEKPLAAGLLLLSLALPLHAQPADVVSAEKIKEALVTPPRTRSLGATRQLEVRPSIALKVGFDFNSAKLTSTGEMQLDELARALQSPELTQKRYAVDGHTDAKGTAEANRKLSELRANAVKQYLVERYGVDAARLVAHGYGLTRLLDPADPLAAANRRVEIVELP